MYGVKVWTCGRCGWENLVEHQRCHMCAAQRGPAETEAEGEFRAEQRPPQPYARPMAARKAFQSDARPAHGPSEAQKRQKHRKDRRQHGPR